MLYYGLSSSSLDISLCLCLSLSFCLHLFLCASDSLPCFPSVAKGFVLRQCGSDGQWGPWRDHSQCENPEKNGVFQVRRGEISEYDFQAAVEKQQPQTEPETPCTIQDSGFQVIEIQLLSWRRKKKILAFVIENYKIAASGTAGSRC